MVPDRRDEKPEDVLEGEIIAPGQRHQGNRPSFEVIKLGWFQRIVLAVLVLCVLALALFISFWVLVVTIPVLMIAAVWSRLRRRAG